MSTRRFPVRFTGLNKAMYVLGMRPANSYIEIGDDTVAVRMGWAFSATFARRDVRSVAADHDHVWGWGVHGLNGTWLLNGSSSGLVRVDLEPGVKARMFGLAVTLKVLRIAVQDPDGLIETLSTPVSA